MNDTIGAKLRQAREQRHLTLQQVSETTKVRTHYLQALENDDLSAMPSLAQARGFLRIYSEFLGLNVADIASEIISGGGKSGKSPEPDLGVPSGSNVMNESRNLSPVLDSNDINSKPLHTGFIVAILARLRRQTKPDAQTEQGSISVGLQPDGTRGSHSSVSSVTENPKSSKANTPSGKSATTDQALDKNTETAEKSIPMEKDAGSSNLTPGIVKKKEIK